MSFFFGRGERRSGDASWFGYGESTTVTEDRAVTLGPVFAAIRHLVDYISTLPADFYRVDGAKRVPVSEPVLIRNVRSEFGLETWLGQAVYSIVTRGNAVGRVDSLSGWRLPEMVRWSGDWSRTGDGLWFVDGRSRPGSLVAHVPWIVPPGKALGLSPIEHYAEIIRAGLSAQEYADIKRGGGLPPAVLKNTKRELAVDVAQSAQARAVAAFTSGKPFVTGADWDLTVTTIPPNHAQFIETLNLSANQIAAIYGIDPREIGGSAPSGSITYSNEESRTLNRSENVRPYVTRLENAVSAMLPEKIRFRLNMDANVRADIKTRTEVVGAQVADGRLSVNEARALEDREPVTGGDFHNVPSPVSAEPTQR